MSDKFTTFASMNLKDSKCPHCNNDLGNIGILGWLRHFDICEEAKKASSSNYNQERKFVIWTNEEGMRAFNRAMKDSFNNEEWRDGNGY